MKEDKVSKEIKNDVNKDKKLEYEFIDEVKLLVFMYLIEGFSFKEFNTELTRVANLYHKKIDNLQLNGLKNIKSLYNVEINEPYFKLDTESTIKARNKYLRVIRDYYKGTASTLDKQIVEKTEYLSMKLTKFDKVEQVVPYFDKDGKIVAYHTLADYNSMVYNTNLTREGWNNAIQEARNEDSDLMYIVPHMFSCPACQQWQGKIISIKGLNVMYPSLDDAMADGFGHPNCKHTLEIWKNQLETNEYSSEEWSEKYDAQQKINALNLKSSRLRNDKKIYKELNNQSEIDKINEKLKKIKTEIDKQQEIIDRES